MDYTQLVDTTLLEQRVKEMYRAVADEPGGHFHFEMGRDVALQLGYDAELLAVVPSAAIESFAGVGHFFDMAQLQPGEAVVDLGSGSGTDLFLAALQVGERGRVTGIDMTDAQLAKAARLAREHGFENVELVQGKLEETPLVDSSADAVISNGVINLCPDKPRAFAEAARLLRPGGRLAIADIVSGRELAERTRRNVDLWAACVAGAIPQDEYLAGLEAAGLTVEAVRENRAYRFTSERALEACGKYEVISVSILARKPA
jgi:arsenite methyltransferase